MGALVGAPALSRGPFGPRDPRRHHVCLPADPRVHFALVCGARSCPPIRTYTAEGLERQLAAAAEAFCAGEVRVVGDPAERTVAVSKIIGAWYKGDFGADDEERLRRVIGYLPEGSRERVELTAVLEAGGGGSSDAPPPPAVTFQLSEYDWTLNGKTSS